MAGILGCGCCCGDDKDETDGKRGIGASLRLLYITQQKITCGLPHIPV